MLQAALKTAGGGREGGAGADAARIGGIRSRGIEGAGTTAVPPRLGLEQPRFFNAGHLLLPAAPAAADAAADLPVILVVVILVVVVVVIIVVAIVFFVFLRSQSSLGGRTAPACLSPVFLTDSQRLRYFASQTEKQPTREVESDVSNPSPHSAREITVAFSRRGSGPSTSTRLQERERRGAER